ncbi:Abscission/NoCut checkpoint regulator like protein [Argiope bruennichi]|uniref:Abscission/NoCut checkpoint regulator like protein n=1 Tax=Argiope bruennichi TaxID=94029 RepID=A0A8T0EK31_ARGBR|nr:Abscission/NoCut checkpoint regulator like protein [Argiope bruennichi]
MSCYSCSSEFGFLKKEVGCEVCGFSFCSKCCKRQQVPSEDGESKKIMCNKCFKELTCDESKPTSKPSPPLAHKRRMQALKKQSFSVDSSAHIRLKSQMSNETDKDLAERLQKLKRDRVKAASPSESEIEERLAKLKGMDPGKYKAPPIQVFRPTEKITAEEQASNLITQVSEEVALDSRLVKPEDEIAARLARLRDEPIPPPKRKTEEFNIPPSLAPGETEEMPISDEYSMLHEESRNLSDQACKEVKKLNTDMEYKNLLSTMQKKKETESEDDEEEADKLVEKLLATQLDDVDMEEMDSLNDLDADKSSSKAGNKESVDEEELPWCVICTEDAKIRCFGCEGDLYCSRCFKECHDSLDIKDHKTCPYLPPKVPMIYQKRAV